MAETSKNKIYYNDNEDSIADILADMKKLAESTDNAIEGAKYDDTEIKRKNTTQDEEIEELQTKVVNLEAENTSLKNQIPQGEATGNPIHLSDSSDMECEIVPIGASEQETRSENLYNSSTNVSGYINSTGDITSNNNWIVTDYIPVIALINYYTAGNTNLTAGEGVYGAYYNSNKELISIFPYSNYKTEAATIAIPENVAYIRFSLYKYADNTATFDFYTDAPSPNYPSKVVTVGQNVNIFNILDYTATLKYTGEAQIFDSNNFRVVAKYSTDSNCMTLFRTIDLTNYAGKTLTIQAIVKSNTDTNKAFIVLRQNNYDHSGIKSNELYDESQNTTDGIITLKYKVGDTINDNNRYLFMGFYATRGNNCNIGDYVDYKVKMVEGTEVGGYSPYGQGSVEIEVCNENFFNFDKLTVTGREESEVTFDKELGKIEATASTSDKYLLKSFTMKGLTVGETYTIGFKHKTKNCTFGGNGIFRLSSTASFNSYDYGYVNGSTSETYSSKTFVAITDALTLSFLGVNGTAPSDTCTMYAKDIMLVKGATAKNYIPHESYTKVLPIQKEFVKIGDVEDTFVKIDGKWYEKHCISKEKFNGAENWENQWSGDRFAWRLTLDNIKTTGSADDKGFVISNYFKLYTQNELYQKSEHYGICNRTNQEQIIIKNDDITSTADFKAYFAEKYANGTPVIVYYVLETPELIPCTAEQESILNSFYTYKGVTNISMSGIGTLKVNYKKDLETLFNNINSALLS